MVAASLLTDFLAVGNGRLSRRNLRFSKGERTMSVRAGKIRPADKDGAHETMQMTESEEKSERSARGTTFTRTYGERGPFAEFLLLLFSFSGAPLRPGAPAKRKRSRFGNRRGSVVDSRSFLLFSRRLGALHAQRRISQTVKCPVSK